MLSCNSYVIKDDVTVLIDTGLGQHVQDLAKDMRQDGIDPKNINIITNTHLHIDHCWGNQGFKELSGAKIALHNLHKQYYNMNLRDMPRLLVPMFGMTMKPIEFTEDSLLDDKLNTEVVPEIWTGG
jgi:glyoxylase-like metal-dependent hydrolase (beta-lactamase superfamily II)